MRMGFLAAAGLCVVALGGSLPASQADATPRANPPSNWAGYAVTGGAYTSVSATWTAPFAANDGQTSSTSYTWVGVDGWANGSLLRVGVQQGWNAGSHVAYHRVFWGTGPSVTVGFNVSVGDGIYASLSETGNNRWSIFLADLNSGRKIARTVNYAGPGQSADFIHSAPSAGELARTGSVLFYNARANQAAAFGSHANNAVDVMANGDVLARPSYVNEAHNAFTITDGPDRPAAPLDQVFQRHSDGSVWVSVGETCRSYTVCGGWEEIDDNPATASIKAGDGTVFQLHKDESLWEWTGGGCQSSGCRDWVELDENAGTTAISAGNGTVYQLHSDGSLWQSTGQMCPTTTSCPGWTELDDNRGTTSLSAGDGSVFQLHDDGSLWQSTGQPCTTYTSCPGWVELDDNAATAAIDAATFKLYQRHRDGSLWQWTGQACASPTSCGSWVELDDNPATAGMSGGVYFYQRHQDGSIWQSTGGQGWSLLDDNAGTVAISAGLLTVYQLHKDGSIWRSTGIACGSATSCPGWVEVDNNKATVQISVSDGSLPTA